MDSFDLNCSFNIWEEIKFILNSKVRLQILENLYKAPLSKKDLKNKTSLSYSSISSNLKALEDKNFVTIINEKYTLTNTFKINFSNLLNTNIGINGILKHRDYLNQHNFFNTKFNSLKDASSLNNVELIRNDPVNVHRVTYLIRDFFIGSHSIKTVFPYLHPEYGIIFEDWLERDVGVKLILPSDVSDALIDIISHYSPKTEIKNRYIKVKNLDKDLDLVVIVSDKGVLFGNYKPNGEFDKNAVLVSRDKGAIELGKSIFEEYESMCGEYFLLDKVLYKNEKKRLENLGEL